MSSAKSTPFGILPNGQRVDKVTLVNAAGMSVEVLSYGATVTSVRVPSRTTGPEEVTLCHADLESLRTNSPYYGATVGRVANRIAKGAFTVEGKAYRLATNNGPNHLHGGAVGYDKVVWDTAVHAWPDGSVSARFTYASHDGEEGYPGAAAISAEYRLTPANELVMEFTAAPDKATPVNLCNHIYWNLSGGVRAKILDHELQIHAPYYVEIDGDATPTGAVPPVAGTPMDFTTLRRVGDKLHSVSGGGMPGYDHCYARAPLGGVPSGGLGFAPIAVLRDPSSGRTMTVSTDQPGVQLYTGNWLSGAAPHAPHFALCLETENWPDAVNQAGFPPAIVPAGSVYSTKTVHAFTW